MNVADAEPLVKASAPPPRPVVAPGEPVRDGAVEVSERLLLHRRGALAQPCALERLSELAKPLGAARPPSGQPGVQRVRPFSACSNRDSAAAGGTSTSRYIVLFDDRNWLTVR